ncbi:MULTISPECIES: glycosyltransferase [unclassified Kaistella]|uniref:glycosyltransferase n=1 Tax=unclassified Kaistella TaxID=2762626 RepID=UPI002734E3B1|nr:MULTISPECIES: glycosyltransferase [unclassified Kaistella]MDP2455205.1 glycosyltransferase [Kaistella sp. SH11-4b]MDP2458179.1 glycosyltransferase [Kaistella sp. SH40-3]MDP2460972.1 glycosyltransferase [Kaistella sp. SH19-2b]
MSNGGTHKNHNNLIDAFCVYYDKKKKGILHITISDEYPELLSIIKNKIDKGYPIVNHGFIPRNELFEIYNSNHYLIFPSLTESFGLGIVEALENGCKVIGADLPYTHAVCKPSITFDPLDVSDMERAFIESQSEHVKDTEQLVFNRIDDLINLLKK